MGELGIGRLVDKHRIGLLHLGHGLGRATLQEEHVAALGADAGGRARVRGLLVDRERTAELRLGLGDVALAQREHTGLFVQCRVLAVVRHQVERNGDEPERLCRGGE